MLPTESDRVPEPNNWTRGVLEGLYRWVLRPSSKIVKPGSRRKARLLSVFLICLFFFFLCVNLAYLFTIPGYHLPVADLVGYSVLIGAYILSRTRLTALALFVLLVMFPMNVLMNILQGTSLNLPVTMGFLLPSYILASIFLGVFWTAVFGYGVNIIILLLPILAPQVVPDYEVVLGSVAIGLICVTLLIISIDNRNKIEQDRQAELRKAYDSTLEGWSRALEIRDKETEGHSHRVSRLTVQLGRACGLRGEDLDYLYRGALLHDIGKMAIPDAILMKKSSLNEEEWAVMRTHPGLAYDMLSSISFIQPALVVPAYHHEWWDGSGYPGGLKGEQIPLPARIFTIVDVWDALLSDRPYRKAWTKEAALKYLRDQSGRQFDPEIVAKFLTFDLENY
jgi:hypothetical protein